MFIRSYRENDIGQLVEIWYEASLLAHSFIPKERWHAHKEDLRQKYLPAAETWVVEEKGSPIGFISLLGNYIGGLFIAPEMQGRGAGALLLNQVKEANEGLTVGVYKQNYKARAFYEKCGFVYESEELQEETGEIIVNMVWNK